MNLIELRTAAPNIIDKITEAVVKENYDYAVAWSKELEEHVTAMRKAMERRAKAQRGNAGKE